MNFARFNVKQLSKRRLRWGLAFLIAMIILPGFLPGLERTAWAVQQNATFSGTAGNWNDATKWSTNPNFPNNGTPVGTTYNVLIDSSNGVNSSVSLNIFATIDNLTIDTGDSLGINNGMTLNLNSDGGVTAGTITNNGSLAMNSSDGSNSTDLVLYGTGDVTLTGTGTLTMSNSAFNVIRDLYGPSNRLVNAAGHTIQGAGHIGFDSIALINQGTIIANQPTPLTIDDASASGFTNQGTMQATGSGGFSTPDAFGNAGIIMIDTGSMFTVDTLSTSDYTQTAGMTTVNGALVSPDRVEIL